MSDPRLPTGDAALDRRIARALRRARLAAALEVGWREAIVPLWLCGLLVGLAWVGLRVALPGPFGAAIVWALAGLAVAASLRAAIRIRRAVRAATDPAAVRGRVERASGLRARELSDLADDLPAPTSDPATRALWTAHRRRVAARIGGLVAGPPRPDLGRRDRWALRPALGLLLFVGWFAAEGEHGARLLAAFGSGLVPPPADRLDVWIEPPLHTGLPPRGVVVDGTLADPAPITAPVGSRLVVRTSPGIPTRPPAPIDLRATPPESLANDETAGSPATPAKPGAPSELRRVLRGDGTVEVRRGGGEALRLTMRPQPDLPPTIALVEPPSRRGRAGLRLVYQTGDDFGVAAARVRTTLPSGTTGRPLWEPPSFPLVLPSGGRHVGRAETVRDLAGHPFAGAEVDLVLEATDGAGGVGRGAPVTVRLPERVFHDPLAAALAELRRRLALDAGAIGEVVVALDALDLAPERFETRFGVHLGLRHLAAVAAAARDDDDLRRLADELWAVALLVDVGDGADAEKALQAARDALAGALRDGVSPEEIERRIRDLRQAMDRYLQSLAEAGRRAPSGRDGAEGGGRRVERQALSRRLDEIEKLARTGSRAAAERLLAELGDTLDQLRAARPGQGGGDASQQALGDLIRRQRDLMDRTRRADRDGADAGERERLLSEQRGLRDELRRLRGKLGEDGASAAESPDGDPLEEADRAMDEAGGAIDRGEGSRAASAQGRAIDGLRRGA
ncbi:MAG: TIGR02302 family protein, partial [Phyllobacteriaceae bacterium]|nr:TIGR02302 family protein [Phyllobacteriaceae bacterium]